MEEKILYDKKYKNNYESFKIVISIFITYFFTNLFRWKDSESIETEKIKFCIIRNVKITIYEY